MHHMDFIIVIKGDLCILGESVDFPKVTTFEKIPVFLCGYGCIKRHKTDSIVSILMKF